MLDEVKVIGSGLAGSEAALQLAKRGVKVKLYEMRPLMMTGAHTTEYCAEFVCSNSLGSSDITNASGLLKKEMEILSHVATWMKLEGIMLNEISQTEKINIK